MAAQRDLVQAQTFLTGRLASALVTSEADAPRTPLHRTTAGVAIGTVLSLLGAAGLLVWGLVSPSAPASWKTNGTVVVDSGTGARYVVGNGVLYPVLNYASALLISDGKAPVSVKDGAVARMPHGTPVGIYGAPEEVPGVDRLTAAPWLVCAAGASSAGIGGGTVKAATTLRVGATGAVPAAAGSALVATDPSGAQYLVWNGTRLRVTGPWVLGALGLSGVAPLPVGYAFLDALPPGPDLASPAVGTLGAPAPAVGGAPALVGQLFAVRAPGLAPQYFVARADGLAPLTDTAADLLLNDPAVRTQVYRGAIAAARDLPTLAGEPQAQATALGAGLPKQPPQALALASAQQVPCARITFTGTAQRTDLMIAPPSAADGIPAQTGAWISADPRTADAFALPPGSGIVVTALTGSGAVGDAHYLVTDTGVKYPVASPAALAALGYRTAPALDVPQSLLTLLPTGPSLDPAAAVAAAVAVSSSSSSSSSSSASETASAMPDTPAGDAGTSGAGAG